MRYFSDVVADKYGNSQSSVSVTVKLNGSNATIYSDTSGTAAANPLTTDGNGVFSFYVNQSGTYTFWVNGVQVGSTYLEDRLNVREFGAKADGASDDSTAFINARALAGGRPIYAPAGTYKLNSVITGTTDLVIEGDGDATVLDFTGTIAGGNYALEAIGTATQIEALSGTQSVGGTTVMFASGPSLSQGDIFVIYNPTDSSWSGFRTYYRAGEWCEVDSISGATVTLKSPLFDTYAAANVNVYKITGPKVSLNNFAIKGTTILGLINASLCLKPLVENVTGDHANDSVVNFDRCFRPTVVKPQIVNVGDGGNDYGIVFGNSQHGRVYGGGSYARRHAVTHGGSNVVCGVPVRDCITFGAVLKNDPNSTAEAANFHGNTELSRFIGCSIYGGGTLAGKDNLFIDCTLFNAKQGHVFATTEALGGFLGAKQCKLVTYVNPFPNSLAIFDIGMSASNVVNANTSKDVTFIAENCTLYARNMSSSTTFMGFKNNGATVNTNFVVDRLIGDVDAMGQLLYTRKVTGTPASQFIIVDRISNLPSGTSLHNDAGDYSGFPMRMLRQTGVYAGTTTNTTSVIAGPITFKYGYSRVPHETVSVRGSGGAAAGTIGGVTDIAARAYQVTTTTIRPMISSSTAFAASASYDQPWSVGINEV